jgi:general secretion pathway protein D
MRRLIKPLLILILTGLFSLPAMAEKTWKINLKDADIAALISEVAEITGKSFIVDSRVKGTVTIITSKPLAADAVYELFLSVLNVNGFAAVPSGSAIKLVPDVNAKQSGVKVDLTGMGRGEEYVTRVISLDNASAIELVPVLRPMLPQFAHLAAVNSSNALVISDHANNIDAVQQIIKGLDTGDSDGLEVMELKQMRVDDMLAMLDGLASSSAVGAPGAGAGGAAGKVYSRVRVVGDPRNNRLILRGDARSRKRLHDMIVNLDNTTDQHFSGVRVFRLRHGSAKEMADVVKGIILGDKGTSSAGSGGGSAPPGATGSATGGTGTTTVSGNGVSMVADESINALVVKADAQMMEQIASLINQVDQRRSQVLIQAAILEISGGDVKQLGVQWAFGNPSQGVGLVNFSDTGSSIAGLAQSALAASAGTSTGAININDGATIGIGRATRNADGKLTGFYGALLEALKSVTTANLLSTPSILTLDNQEAKIVVGQNVPFITGSSTSTSSGASNPFQTIERQDVGITLKVVPHIGDGGAVRLEVEQEVSSVVPASSSIKSADIITNKRSIKTVILADDGQTIVLGGLMQDDKTSATSKVPLLGDIPLLGWLFRSSSDSKTKDNLLVFLRPTILHDSLSASDLSMQQYGGMRALQLSVSDSGDITRLPEQVGGIFQGATPTPAPAATPAAPAAAPAPSAAPATH